MQFDWWTFAFQVVNVVILIWLLSHFMFRPVAKIIADRRADTSRALEAAEVAKRKADEAEAAARAEKEKNAAERLTIIEAAREEAEGQKNAILEDARKEAVETLRKAKADAAQAAEEERKARVRKAADLAVVIARRLLGNLPEDGRIAGYPKRLQAALASLDAEQREALGAETGALRLRAPRPLTKAELAAAGKAIRAALPEAPEPEVDVDDTLIAGLELTSRHGVIHNSLNYDLGRITEALENDGEV
ncbi:ATPase [Defluviimonas sp. SAOS-178_SWC]|uniref:F0F1 ATP synthase subunit B family protein n=1 Tax=Defluviimonas sp. SAOS-178_SWC TaxID=3121287 RepID=UPI003221B011